MAITKIRDDKANNKYDSVIDDNNVDDSFMVFLKSLANKIDEGLTETNDHINKVASMQSEINTEKNKMGITTAQANAIVANTAKTGITTEQAKAITVNTAKTGITSQQAADITANNAKVGITTKQATQLTALVQSAIQLSSSIKGTTVASPSLTLIEGRKAGTYSLRIAVRITVNEGKAQVKYIDLPLT